MAGSSSRPPTDTGKSIPPDPIGSVLAGRYRLESRLGAGGFGVVYRAWDIEGERGVAVKVLHEELGARKSLQRRFAREAKAMMALSHPNIVAIVDYGVANGAPFLAMELLEGHGLDVELKRSGSLSEKRLRFVMSHLLSGIGYMHGEGLIHRDLKPGNVFVQRLPDGSDRIKVLDFGLAKFLDTEDQSDIVALTRTGEVFGTPAYMPPEQLAGEELDYRADVYTAAVMMFQMLSGRRPFEGAPHEVLRKVLVEAPPTLQSVRPECRAHPDVELWFQKALGKKPAERFADAPGLQAALDGLPSPMLLPPETEPSTTELSASDLASAGGSPVPEMPAVEMAAPKGDGSRARSESADTLVRGPLQVERAGEKLNRVHQDLSSVSPVARFVASIAAGMRRIVIVSATLISVLSVLVIGAAALLIFTAPDKSSPEPAVVVTAVASSGAEHLPAIAEAKRVHPRPGHESGSKPEKLPKRMPRPVVDEVKKVELAANIDPAPAVGVPTKPGRVQSPKSESAKTDSVQPSEPKTLDKPASIASIAPIASIVPVAPKASTASKPPSRPRARDPFRRRTPKLLAQLRRRLLKGYKGTEKTIGLLRRYNRGHPDDSRGHLLMATLYMNRIWHRDAVTQYGFAFARDAASRGYRPMLRDLIKLSGEGSARSEAMALVRRAYGLEAKRAVQRAIKSANDKGMQRRLRRLETSLVKQRAGSKR